MGNEVGSNSDLIVQVCVAAAAAAVCMAILMVWVGVVVVDWNAVRFDKR